MAELPDRVLLYGVTGSGKSTAALAVGARTGHPVTLVDELTWLPGWVPVDGSVQRELIGDVVAGEWWLLDSAYGRLVLAKVLGLAGLVAFGAWNRLRVLPRLVPAAGAHFDDAPRDLRASTRRELALMLIVSLVAGVLAYVPPPGS